MRVIIACAGPQDKWNNYLGIRSHFVPVLTHPDVSEREPLLARTVRQALRYAPDDDIHITCPPGMEDLYSVEGATTHGVTGTSEFDSTRHLWNEDGRTALLLGDVYFSDLAMRKIFQHPIVTYMSFGRYAGSTVTHTPYGELFGHKWYPQHHYLLDEHMKKVDEARESGITRPFGWMLLRSIQGTDLDKHMVRPRHFTQIYDWTDDIDFPHDFDRHPATKGYE